MTWNDANETADEYGTRNGRTSSSTRGIRMLWFLISLLPPLRSQSVAIGMKRLLGIRCPVPRRCFGDEKSGSQDPLSAVELDRPYNEKQAVRRDGNDA